MLRKRINKKKIVGDEGRGRKKEIDVEQRRMEKKLHLLNEQKRCMHGSAHTHTHTFPFPFTYVSLNHLKGPVAYLLHTIRTAAGNTKGRTFGFDKMTENLEQ